MLILEFIHGPIKYFFSELNIPYQYWQPDEATSEWYADNKVRNSLFIIHQYDRYNYYSIKYNDRNHIFKYIFSEIDSQTKKSS